MTDKQNSKGPVERADGDAPKVSRDLAGNIDQQKISNPLAGKINEDWSRLRDAIRNEADRKRADLEAETP